MELVESRHPEASGRGSRRTSERTARAAHEKGTGCSCRHMRQNPQTTNNNKGRVCDTRQTLRPLPVARAVGGGKGKGSLRRRGRRPWTVACAPRVVDRPRRPARRRYGESMELLRHALRRDGERGERDGGGSVGVRRMDAFCACKVNPFKVRGAAPCVVWSAPPHRAARVWCKPPRRAARVWCEPPSRAAPCGVASFRARRAARTD